MDPKLKYKYIAHFKDVFLARGEKMKLMNNKKAQRGSGMLAFDMIIAKRNKKQHNKEYIPKSWDWMSTNTWIFNVYLNNINGLQW